MLLFFFLLLCLLLCLRRRRNVSPSERNSFNALLLLLCCVYNNKIKKRTTTKTTTTTKLSSSLSTPLKNVHSTRKTNTRCCKRKNEEFLHQRVREKLKNTTMRSTSKRVINKTFQSMASNNTPPAVLVVGSSFSF